MTIHIQLAYQQRIATIWANHLNQTGTIPWTPMCCPAPPHPPTIPERVPGPPCVAQLLPTLQAYLNEFLDPHVSPSSSPPSKHTWTSSWTPKCRPDPPHSPTIPERVPWRPCVAQLLSTLPSSRSYSLIDHGSIVSGWVGKQPGSCVGKTLCHV